MIHRRVNFAFCKRRSAGANGMALVLVVAVMATAAVLAYALLAVNTLQAQVSSNLMDATAAEYAAESGINVAMYYLQNPSAAPASWTQTAGYALYAQSVPLNDGTAASFNVSVVPTSQTNTYQIQSTGYSGNAIGTSHISSASVVLHLVPIPAAGVFGSDVTIPAGTVFSNNSIAGAAAVQANGTITLSGGTVSGPQVAAPLSSSAYVCPTASTVNYYGVGMSTGTYLWTDGVTIGTPQQITTGVLDSSGLPSIAPNNPAGILYHQGDLVIVGDMTINGTLIIRGGNLLVGAKVTINPATSFPALICEDGAAVGLPQHLLTANGVVFVGGGITWNGNTQHSSFNVNGALVLAPGATLATPHGGQLNVAYVPANVNVPNLTTYQQPVASITVSSWNP
jgi:hypothetical protein